MRKVKKGFNLVEMLIVLGVVIFLSAVILPAYGPMRAKFALLRSAYQLAQDIKIAREMAISARVTAGGIPPGYGVYLVEGNSNYVIYIDTNGNKKFNAGGDGKFKDADLENKVYIQDISGSTPKVSINFTGPDPNVSIDGSPIPATIPATVTLGLEGSGETKNIYINGVGLIYVE